MLGLFALIICLSLRRIWEVDYWWQWGMGRWISANGIPRAEPFSFTEWGAPIIEARWLYCLAIYAIEQSFGVGALIVGKTLVVLATFAPAWRDAARRVGVVSASALVALAALASSQRLFVRPETLSLLFLATFIFVVGAARERRTALLWILPAVQVLWANTHSMFLLGPAVVGAWLVSELLCRPDPADPARGWRRPALLLAATLAASLLNPYAHRVFAFAINHYGALHATSQKGFFVELAPTWTLSSSLIAAQFFWVLVALALLSCLLNRRALDLFWLLLGGAMLYLSLTAVRNMPLLALAAIPLIVRNLDASLGTSAEPRTPPTPTAWSARRGVLALVVAALCGWQCWRLGTDRFAVQQNDTREFGLGISAHRAPVGATEALLASGIRGNVYHDPTIGSYLIARGIPVFIDPRGEVYQDRIIAEYSAIAQNPQRFDDAAARHRFEAALIQTEDLAMLTALSKNPAWRLVYLDATAAMFLARGSAPATPDLELKSVAPALAESLRAELNRAAPLSRAGLLQRVASPAPALRLGRALALLGYAAPATTLLELAALYSPSGLGADDASLLEVVRARTGDRNAANALAQQRSEANPADEQAALAAARAAVNAGQLEQAMLAADRALAANSSSAEAFAIKGAVLLRQNRLPDAEETLSRAAALDPKNAMALKNLARTSFALGKREASVAQFEQAWQADPQDAGTARDLALILARLGRAAEARTWIDRAAALAPNDASIAAARRTIDALPTAPGAQSVPGSGPNP